MKNSARYTLALLLVIAYYGHAFVPIFTLSESAGGAGSVVPGLEFLQGFSLYDYHYLSIGVVPFVFAGILMQLLRWQLPTVFFMLSRNADDGAFSQRVVSYAIGAVMAYVMVSRIPDDRFSFSAALTFAELLLTLSSVEQILRLMKKIDIVTSPVMLFLGLNVLSAIGFKLYALPYADFSVLDWQWFGGLAACCLATVVMVVRSMNWFTPVRVGSVLNGRGTWVEKTVSFKVLRAGITPVIYSIFLFAPVFMWMESRTPSVTLVEYPSLLIVFFLIMYWMSYKLILLTIQSDGLIEFCSRKGIVLFFDDNDAPPPLSVTLKALSLSQARAGALFFTLLITLEGAWGLLAPAQFSSVGVVGGIGLVLFFGVIDDVAWCFHRHKQELLS